MGQDIRKTTTGVHFSRNLDASLVSVVIPCYNDHLYVEQAINSALAQTWPFKEIIVVDDGSNQKTKAKLNSLATKIDKLIYQENKGPGAARNAGIGIARGKFILVLDSDDYFEPDFCEKAIEAFFSKEEVVLVTCYARWFFNSRDSKIFKPRGGRLKDVLFSNIAMGSSMFTKRAWEDIEGYDEAMIKGFEDWEFYIRLLKNGGETYVIPEVLFHYRKKVTSRNSIANDNKYELLEYIYLKHSKLYKDNFETFTKHLLKLLENSKRKEFSKGPSTLSRIKKIIKSTNGKWKD